MRLDPPAVTRLASRQHGVVTTSQLVAAGADTSWVTRQVDSGRWQRLHRGVLVTHSGPVAWRSRATAGLLYAGDRACLSHESAAYLHEFRVQPPRVVTVTIPGDRRLAPTAGLVVHHRRTMPPSAGNPRRTWRGDTVVDLAAAATSHDDAVGWVCDAVRSGVRPLEILDALARRARPRNAALLHELLDEVVDGVESPLELRYRRRVERAHGLPPAELQVRHRVDDAWIRADVVYRGLGVRVELDGRLAHPGGRTDADTWRDNAVLLEHGDLTLRYRWWHVAVTPCATAHQVASALRSRGWTGRPHPCSPSCAIR
ncbi:type IV toxin-antitoxin system AbiEi family antitoxin domain-containing protein [Actinotalea ferrariae]|uniref:type IV toxin-antitoxin system AbiEi family antitoxin domain-containing protein n=1 Tax=Actinotalea ferrariae TaxID=1386098 RepID=UPI001C8CBB26|nr:type IV toxin-antitoxin system AbiEi family antitoxin domain-containing protein [Actinotalea ferrariae]MBX9244890.1 type IV toxin-antitoxin system AbiEi family antitoxin domain-containing protein [Actinotalea ferrariae]